MTGEDGQGLLYMGADNRQIVALRYE